MCLFMYMHSSSSHGHHQPPGCGGFGRRTEVLTARGCSSELRYSISNICSLNIIIIIGVKHTGSDTMQQILGVGIKASED